MTATVALVFAVTKFTDGAWIVIVLVPALVGLMLLIRRQYDARRAEAAVERRRVFGSPTRERFAVVPVGDLSRDTVAAANLARTVAREVIVVHVTDDQVAGKMLRERFEHQLPGVSFVLIVAPYRTIVEPLVRYLDELAADHPDAVTVVFLPEYVERHWWERILFNETARSITTALLERDHILVARVPYRRHVESG